MKLPKKLRLLKFEKRWKYADISGFTGASIQAVKNWCNDDRCPKALKRHFADELVKVSNGDITLKDCGIK